MPDTTTTLPDYYEALQVSPNADAEFIRAAYKRLVEKWHADRRPGNPTAFERLTLLDEAFAVLSDPVKRREYDSRRPRPDTGSVDQEILAQRTVESHTDSKPPTRWPWWLAIALVLTAIVGLIFAGKEEPHSASSKEESTVAILERLEGGADANKESRDDGQSTPLTPDVLFARISPAVVQIVTFDRSGRAVGSGSGFLVSKKGLIATNYHVIEKAHTAQVVLTGEKKVPVQGVVGFDEEVDIAILKVASTIIAQPLELAANEPPIGAKVYAIGNPLGLANTLSDGLVSGYREIDRTRVIQTTAPISPGSSGGPLLGSDGKVVGVTTSGFRGGQNLNFAVPSSNVASLLSRSEKESRPIPLPLPSTQQSVPTLPRISPTNYFPTSLGTTWVYKGRRSEPYYETTMTIKVTSIDANGATLETLNNDKVVASESIQVKPDGVYRTRINKVAITPAIKLLPLKDGKPLAKGTSWVVKSVIQNQMIKGTFNVEDDAVIVKVPAGEFMAAVVEGPDFEINGSVSAVKYWFSPGMGIVKLTMDVAGKKFNQELQEFTLGKK